MKRLMKMLPIPVPITRTSKRLLAPLVYLVVTTLLGYILLLAILRVSPQRHRFGVVAFDNHFPFSHEKSEAKEQSAPKLLLSEVEVETFFDAYLENKPVNTTATWKFKKKPETNQNAARRSNSPEIRACHQNYSEIIDYQSPSTRPWPLDKECSCLHVHFANLNTFPPRALVSFPGSGNSWLRFMIESSTGFFTGSIYNDSKVYQSGLLGEVRDFKDGSTIIQKTHDISLNGAKVDANPRGDEFAYRGVLVIRNPYDALKSYWAFLQTFDHKTMPKFIQTPFKQIKWYKFVRDFAPKWASLITTWVDHSSSLLIVQYERLKKNPRSEIIRILRYLDQAVDTKRLDCLMKVGHIEGPFHRPKAKKQNSLLRTYDYLPLVGEFETKKKFSDYGQVADRNSKSRSNTTGHNPEQQSALAKEQNISSNNHVHPSPLSLDLIVQDNIQKINRFFSEKGISIFLDYRGPTTK